MTRKLLMIVAGAAVVLATGLVASAPARAQSGEQQAIVNLGK